MSPFPYFLLAHLYLKRLYQINNYHIRIYLSNFTWIKDAEQILLYYIHWILKQ